jgi:hypothetical protein
MAVHRDNLLEEEEENEEDNALFEGDGLVDQDSDIPPHLRDLARAAQTGDVDALRYALGEMNILLFFSLFLFFSIICLKF